MGTYNLALPTTDREDRRQTLASVREKNVPLSHLSNSKDILYYIFVYCEYQKESRSLFLDRDDYPSL